MAKMSKEVQERLKKQQDADFAYIFGADHRLLQPKKKKGAS